MSPPRGPADLRVARSRGLAFLRRGGAVELCRRFRLTGWEAIHRAHAGGRGALFLLPRVALWQLAAVPPGLYGGPLVLAGDPGFAAPWARYGIEAASPPGLARRLVRTLRNGGRVGFPVDPESPGDDCLRLARIAAAARAAVLVAVVRPGRRGRFHWFAGEPVAVSGRSPAAARDLAERCRLATVLLAADRGRAAGASPVPMPRPAELAAAGRQRLDRARIAAGKGPLVGLLLGSEGGRSRPWRHWAEIARGLRRQVPGSALLLVVDSRDLWSAVRVHEETGHLHPVVGPDLDTAGLAAVLLHLDLAVGGPSRLLRLGAALGVATLPLPGGRLGGGRGRAQAVVEAAVAALAHRAGSSGPIRS